MDVFIGTDMIKMTMGVNDMGDIQVRIRHGLQNSICFIARIA